MAGRSEARPGAPRDRRPAKRHGPVSLLATGGDRRRSRHATASVPRGDRELATRPQHRGGRAERERLPRGRGAHHRPTEVEPPRRDGDRPVPAREVPRDTRRVRLLGARSCPRSASTTFRGRNPSMLRISRNVARSCSDRKGRASPRTREGSAGACCPSRSSVRPGRSTPASPRGSRCTSGSAVTAPRPSR